MEENDVSQDNLELARRPKALKDLIKLKELQLKIEEARMSKASLNNSRKAFRLKHFFIYLFPAVLQLVTVYAAYIAVVKSKFFESANNYAEARTIRLKIDEDSLKSHKARLHDSIAQFSNELNIEKKQLSNYTLSNTKLDSANTRLKGAIIKSQNVLYQFGMQYYGGLADSYPTFYVSTENNSIEYLITQSKLPGDKDIIKKHIDEELKRSSKDTLEHLENMLHLSALGYFCFSSQNYRQAFMKYLSSYVSLHSLKNGDEAYSQKLLNTIRYKKWTEKYIVENYSILFKDAMIRHQEKKLAHIVMWTAYHPLESSESEKIQLMPDYWPDQHRVLLQLNRTLLSTDSLTITDAYYMKDAKNNAISLFCECPQCYVALEAEVIHKYLHQFKKQHKPTDSIPLNLTLRMKGDDAFTIKGTDYLEKARIFSLLTQDDLLSYSPKLPPIMKKIVSLNNVIALEDLADSDEILDKIKLFESYYEKNKEKFQYWLSADRANEINKPWFQEKLLSYKL